MKLIEISVEIDGEAAEAVSTVFNQYGQGGTVIEELHPADLSLPPIVRAKTFLSEENQATLPRIEEALWHLGCIYPLPSPTVRWLSEADWADAWKVGYKPQRIGRRIRIQPSWQPCEPSADQIVIELDPGLAFGTGLHPSTRLCLLALEDCAQPGQRVLDVGTGSGILSIAAARLGAGSIVAIDIDDLALQVARENIARNGVQASISLSKASLTPPTTCDWPVPNGRVEVFNADGQWSGAFDLIVMNILAEVIAGSAKELARCLAPDGTFILAGIIQAREALVREALAEAGLDVRRRLVQKDWVALIGGKESAHSDTTTAS